MLGECWLSSIGQLRPKRAACCHTLCSPLDIAKHNTIHGHHSQVDATALAHTCADGSLVRADGRGYGGTVLLVERGVDDATVRQFHLATGTVDGRHGVFAPVLLQMGTRKPHSVERNGVCVAQTGLKEHIQHRKA